MNLDPYKCQINVAGQPLGGVCWAHSMDANNGKPVNGNSMKDLRIDLGLGTCSVCDYFRVVGDTVILVEETQLELAKRTMAGNYPYLKKGHLGDLFKKLTFTENQLKVCGSLLVLCHLAKLPGHVGLSSCKHTFILIASGQHSKGVERAFTHLQANLKNCLKGYLSKKRIKDVVVTDDQHLKILKTALKGAP